MRKIFLALCTLACVALTPGAVGAAPPGDSARGTERGPFSTTTFSARSTATGLFPDGTYKITNRGTDPNVVIEGRITCFETVSNLAVAAGPVTHVRPAGGSAVTYVIIFAQDNGRDMEDGMIVQQFFSFFPPPNPCPTPVPVAPDGFDDVTIRNEPPLT